MHRGATTLSNGANEKRLPQQKNPEPHWRPQEKATGRSVCVLCSTCHINTLKLSFPVLVEGKHSNSKKLRAKTVEGKHHTPELPSLHHASLLKASVV